MAWTITHVDRILRGFKSKTCSLPGKMRIHLEYYNPKDSSSFPSVWLSSPWRIFLTLKCTYHMQMNVTGRLRPWSQQGKISSTAEGLKNPNLIGTSAWLGLSRERYSVLLCQFADSREQLAVRQGPVWLVTRGQEPADSTHTMIINGGARLATETPSGRPQACQCLSGSLWQLDTPEGAVGKRSSR